MGSPKGPSAVKDENAEALPLWMSRHVDLGFTDDDLAGFVEDMESTDRPTSSPPQGPATASSAPSDSKYLPPEIMIYVLQAVPPTHILPCRLVCRFFRDIVDTYVFYSYLPRIKLLREIGRPDTYKYWRQTKKDLLKVTATFASVCLPPSDAHLDRNLNESTAKWDHPLANFRTKIEHIEPDVQCQLAFAKMGTSLGQLLVQTPTYDIPERGRWIVFLDTIVNDTALPGLSFDSDSGTITFDWRQMLWELLREERAIQLKMEATHPENSNSEFRFSSDEDCLRHVRRQRLRRGLDPEQFPEDMSHLWSINNLRPLFTRRARPYKETPIQHAEDAFCPRLVIWRREAALSSLDKYVVDQFLKDKDDMTWMNKEVLSTIRSLCQRMITSQPQSVDPDEHHLAWDSQRWRLERGPVDKYRLVRSVMANIRSLAQEANEILDLVDMAENVVSSSPGSD